MSILIKGMEMPKFCRECPCYHKHYDSGWYDYLSCGASKTVFNDGYSQKTIVINPDKERLPNCPFGKLPPHGRLIDAEKLCELCDMMAEKCGDPSVWNQFRAVVENLPTIVEAEEEEEWK